MLQQNEYTVLIFAAPAKTNIALRGRGYHANPLLCFRTVCASRPLGATRPRQLTQASTKPLSPVDQIPASAGAYEDRSAQQSHRNSISAPCRIAQPQLHPFPPSSRPPSFPKVPRSRALTSPTLLHRLPISRRSSESQTKMPTTDAPKMQPPMEAAHPNPASLQTGGGKAVVTSQPVSALGLPHHLRPMVIMFQSIFRTVELT